MSLGCDTTDCAARLCIQNQPFGPHASVRKRPPSAPRSTAASPNFPAPMGWKFVRKFGSIASSQLTLPSAAGVVVLFSVEHCLTLPPTATPSLGRIQSPEFSSPCHVHIPNDSLLVVEMSYVNRMSPVDRCGTAMPPEVRGPAPSWFSSNARNVSPFSFARSNAAYRKRPSNVLQPRTMSVFGVLLPVMKSQAPGSVSLSPPANFVSEPLTGSSAGMTLPAMSCQSFRPSGPVAWSPSSPAKQLNDAGAVQAA